MKRLFFVVACLYVQQNIFAQAKAADTTKKQIDLEDVVISSSNFLEKKKNIAQKIDLITAKTIANANAQNTGDLLINTGKIFVQKSQQGGSSPVIRGFEASRVLLVIDGVRMNNAIYRTGHLQNAITIDQNSLSRLEIMYGPSSTVYGSDALGGTIHLITKSPIFSSSNKVASTGLAFARHSTVNNEKTIHVDASLGLKKIAWYQAYNFSDFGDLKMGSNYLSAYPNFGRRSQYIGQVNGIDSVLDNADDRVQKFSAYKQWDMVQKLLFKQNDSTTHGLNIQISNSTNVPRYDRLQDIKNGTLRFAEWYYGPQKRFLAAYEFQHTANGFFKTIKANINYQNIEESRQTREYRRLDRFESQVEKVKVIGATISGRKIINNHELVMGADMQLNIVNSTATRTNLNTGVVSPLNTRYPDGKNNMNNFGIYAQHTYKFKNKKLVLNDGFRLQFINLKSNIIDNSFFKLPDTVFNQKNIAFTGNIGVVYTASKSTSIATSIASGFRAPNIDDLSKIFETNTATRQVVFPNANLKPEYTYNVDLSITQKIGKTIVIDITGYYTQFSNAIVKAPFTINGQDSIDFNGIRSQILASQNINNATVAGFSIGTSIQLFKGCSLASTLSYTKAFFKVDVNKTSAVYEKQGNGTYAIVHKKVSQKPLDHISPALGKTSIVYEYKLFNTEFNILYNGWKRLDEYNADGEDNAQYATADGMPAWVTANWKAGFNFSKNATLQIGVDNIFDRNYRTFASGFSSGGRNFMLALRMGW
jgi:hemoglobin/transferrin/lactoferrin receptor protein